MHGRIKWTLLCLLIAVSTTACTTVRYRKMVGVHFSNRGPGEIHTIIVKSGDCTWPLQLLDAGKNGGSGITLYCKPSEQLVMRWLTAQREPRELTLPIQAPFEQSVTGWRLQFAEGTLKVWQEEERNADILTPRTIRQIYP